MKLLVELLDRDREEEIILRCHEESKALMEEVRSIAERRKTLCGKAEGNIYRIELSDIFYFESVDNHSFFYTESRFYESRLKVYEFEELTKNSLFFKASRSTVVNIRKIKSVRPTFSGKFEHTLLNDYRLEVSRLYVSELKVIMGID